MCQHQHRGDKNRLTKTLNRVRLYRWFRYFQQGFSLLSLPISLVSTATIFYYLMIDHFTVLKNIFPQFIYFLGVGALGFVPIAVVLGWYYTKRSNVYGSEQVLLTEVNPLNIHSSRVGYEVQLATLKKLDVELSPELMSELTNIVSFWQQLDKEKRWRP